MLMEIIISHVFPFEERALLTVNLTRRSGKKKNDKRPQLITNILVPLSDAIRLMLSDTSHAVTFPYCHHVDDEWFTGCFYQYERGEETAKL